MTPTEYEFVTESIRELKTALENVRGDVNGNAISQGNALASVSQKVSDLQDRLFLGDMSAISRLAKGLESLDKRFTAEVDKENTVCLADRKEMRESIVTLRVKMAVLCVVYGVGASAFVTLVTEGLKRLVSGHF